MNPLLRKASLFLAIVLVSMISSAKITFAQRAVIAFDGVKIYSLPMVDDSPAAVMMKGDTVKVLGQRGEWVKVAFKDGRKGWMQIQVPGARASNRHSRVHASEQDGHSKSPSASNELASGKSTNGGSEQGTNGNHAGSGIEPDLVPDRPKSQFADTQYRRFGYSFGFGLLETDFTYNWKFLFHSTPRLALEGSFKHALGQAADSYFIMVNMVYLLKENRKFLPYLTGGVGVVNTVPERSIDTGTVSHMAINLGLGARKYFRKDLSILFNVSNYTIFVGKGINNFKELTVGLLVGKFWD